MLYEAPQTFNGPDLLFHRFQTMAEQNALNQARRTRVFPTARRINTQMRLKDGRTLSPKGLGRLSPRLRYGAQSAPYLSGHRRRGLGDVTDFFSGIKNAVTGTVSAVTGTVAGVANAAQPLEVLLQNNPSLVNLVKTYLPGPSTISQPALVARPVVVSTPKTLGVSNNVWLIGAAGAGALALIKMLGRR